MQCNKCGMINNSQDKFCANCGAPLQSQPNMVQNNMMGNPVNNEAFGKNSNNKYANISLLITAGLCIISLFFGIGLLWVIIIAGAIYPIIKKGMESNEPTKGKIALVLLGVFVIEQIIVFIIRVMGLLN